MNAPPIPEPVNAPLVTTAEGAQMLQSPPVLRRFPLEEAPGYALEVSDLPEAVYLLGRPDGSEVPVPCRLCGTWNPAVISGRHFFLSHEPDVALDLVSVRRADQHIGRLAFPSGWPASPWFAASSRKVLLRRLQEFSAAFLEVRLERSLATTRAATQGPARCSVR